MVPLSFQAMLLCRLLLVEVSGLDTTLLVSFGLKSLLGIASLSVVAFAFLYKVFRFSSMYEDIGSDILY